MQTALKHNMKKKLLLPVCIISACAVLLMLIIIRPESRPAGSRIWPDNFENADDTSLESAIQSMDGGGTLFIRGGEYSLETDSDVCLDLGGIRGREDNYIIIKPLDGKKVVLDGSNAQGSDGLRCFYMSGTSFVRISGLTIRNFSDPLSVQAFDIEDASDHIIIDNCDISGICVDAPDTEDHCANAILCYNSSTDVQHDISIKKNKIHECATGWSEAISVDGNNETISIADNSISDTGNIGIDLAGNYGACPDASLDFTRKAEVCHNRVKGCISAYGDTAYGIYADGAHDVMISKNTVTGCSGGIEAGAEQPSGSAENVSICRNVLINNSVNEITIGGWTDDERTGIVKNTAVRDNVVINTGSNGSEGVLTLSKLDGAEICENRIVNLSASDMIVRSFGPEYVKKVMLHDNYCFGNTENMK